MKKTILILLLLIACIANAHIPSIVHSAVQTSPFEVFRLNNPNAVNNTVFQNVGWANGQAAAITATNVNTPTWKSGSTSATFWGRNYVEMSDNLPDGFYFADRSEYSLGNKDFTIEYFGAMWTKDVDRNIASHGYYNSPNGLSWAWVVATTENVYIRLNHATGVSVDSTIFVPGVVLSTLTKYHLVFERYNGTLYFYVNGQKAPNTYNIGTDSLFDSSDTLAIGYNSTRGSGANNMAMFRILNGFAKYKGRSFAQQHKPW